MKLSKLTLLSIICTVSVLATACENKDAEKSESAEAPPPPSPQKDGYKTWYQYMDKKCDAALEASEPAEVPEVENGLAQLALLSAALQESLDKECNPLLEKVKVGVPLKFEKSADKYLLTDAKTLDKCRWKSTLGSELYCEFRGTLKQEINPWRGGIEVLCLDGKGVAVESDLDLEAPKSIGVLANIGVEKVDTCFEAGGERIKFRAKAEN